MTRCDSLLEPHGRKPRASAQTERPAQTPSVSLQKPGFDDHGRSTSQATCHEGQARRLPQNGAGSRPRAPAIAAAELLCQDGRRFVTPYVASPLRAGRAARWRPPRRLPAAAAPPLLIRRCPQRGHLRGRPATVGTAGQAVCNHRERRGGHRHHHHHRPGHQRGGELARPAPHHAGRVEFRPSNVTDRLERKKNKKNRQRPGPKLGRQGARCDDVGFLIPNQEPHGASGTGVPVPLALIGGPNLTRLAAMTCSACAIAKVPLASTSSAEAGAPATRAHAHPCFRGAARPSARCVGACACRRRWLRWLRQRRWRQRRRRRRQRRRRRRQRRRRGRRCPPRTGGGGGAGGRGGTRAGRAPPCPPARHPCSWEGWGGGGGRAAAALRCAQHTDAPF